MKALASGAALILLAIAAFLGMSSVFTVNPTEQALVLRFGQAVSIVREPGLYFKLPFVDGVLPATGHVGGEVGPEDAVDYARQCALNILAVADQAVGLDAVVRVVKLVGFVASAPGFSGQPGVINGASNLMADVFGEAGRHARSAVGVAELPLGAPVEVEAILQVR